jgi:hypothetical protein
MLSVTRKIASPTVADMRSSEHRTSLCNSESHVHASSGIGDHAMRDDNECLDSLCSILIVVVHECEDANVKEVSLVKSSALSRCAAAAATTSAAGAAPLWRIIARCRVLMFAMRVSAAHVSSHAAAHAAASIVACMRVFVVEVLLRHESESDLLLAAIGRLDG